MIDDLPPRKVGMLAAQMLSRSIDDNPMSAHPLPDGTEKSEAGHPWKQWRNGFADCRVLLHKQNRQALALGVGLIQLWRLSPEPTKNALIDLGRNSGETICLVILAAMLEAEETRYDLDDPHCVLVIYSAMKLRMTQKPPQCHHEESWDLHNRAHNVAGALHILFTTPKGGQVALNVAAMMRLLDSLCKMDGLNRDAIANGKYQHDHE
jgi:hypothetical protein